MTLPSGLPRLRRRDRMRAVVVGSTAAVAAAALLLWLVVRYAAEEPDKVRLGDATFEVAKADRLARRIEAEGAPFLFKDPLTRGAGREVYVQHLGESARRGWVAIEAYAPGAPRELRCLLRWDRATSTFRDPCGDGTFPRDGAGLRRYRATVDGRGVVVVDLREPLAAGPTTTTGRG